MPDPESKTDHIPDAKKMVAMTAALALVRARGTQESKQ